MTTLDCSAHPATCTRCLAPVHAVGWWVAGLLHCESCMSGLATSAAPPTPMWRYREMQCSCGERAEARRDGKWLCQVCAAAIDQQRTGWPA